MIFLYLGTLVAIAIFQSVLMTGVWMVQRRTALDWLGNFDRHRGEIAR